jgi:transposase
LKNPHPLTEGGGKCVKDLEAEVLKGAGNVPASAMDAEDVVVGKERSEAIHRLRAAGVSVSQIARASGLDRKTVRRALAQAAWQPYRRALAEKTLLSAHEGWLLERAAQVNYSARILFQELRRERGYVGSYQTVRDAVRPLRAEAVAASLTQCRFETEPGEQAQADWGQARAPGWQARLCAHLRAEAGLLASGLGPEAYEHERMESLLAAHEHGFAHFGGVTREILYDRMRTLLQGERDGTKRWNPTFQAFAQYWGSEPRVCRPYRAKTKGKVESGVRYVKRNFLPGRSFGDLADLNEPLAARQAEIADLRLHGTTHEVPRERFGGEAAALIPVAGRAGFLDALIRRRVVADDWLVTVALVGDDHRVVQQPIQQRGGHDSVAEDLGPLAEAAVARHDHRGARSRH